MAIGEPNTHLIIIRSLPELRASVAKWRADGLRIGFAPTMGALHDGHLSLVDAAAAAADRVVASIFVNPSQFAPHEDFDTYPRDEESDLDKLCTSPCDLVYLPDVSTMYPKYFQTSVTVEEVAKGLCGASRPHFFSGVATVVCKLLNQCAPDVAVFGEKDFQQLLVIRRMVRDLDMPVEILGAPIVREPDGLAMSSRNARLTGAARAVAGRLNGVLARMAHSLRNGEDAGVVLADGENALDAAGVDAFDYLEIRDLDAFTPINSGSVMADARIFLAAHVGGVRLIDNWPVEQVSARPATS